MNVLPWIMVILFILIAAYFYNQNNKSKAIANNTVSAIAASVQEFCTPFTKEQQDAEKRDKQAKCANKLLIPFVGPAQYTVCMKNIASTLTPIKNC